MAKKPRKTAQPQVFDIQGLTTVRVAEGDDLAAALPTYMGAGLWNEDEQTRLTLRLPRQQLDDINTHSTGSLNGTIVCLLAFAMRELRRQGRQLRVARDSATARPQARKR